MTHHASGVPHKPPPEFSPHMKSTATSWPGVGLNVKSQGSKHSGPKRGAVTHQEQLAALAKNDLAVAIGCAPLKSIAGPYSLAVFDTAPVHMPPRQSFLSGASPSLLAHKRWNRSQQRAQTVAHSNFLEQRDTKQTAIMMGMSPAEFSRSKGALTK